MVDPDRQKKINGSLPRALALILRAQAVQKSSRHKGGWRYHPNSRDSDTSCSGWALMALRSAKLNGADGARQGYRRRRCLSLWKFFGKEWSLWLF